MMSQSLEILNCDEHLIFMDTFRNGDINNVVSEAYFFSNFGRRSLLPKIFEW